jgi:hypothetical protein
MISYNDLTAELLRRFPELQAAYEQQRHWASEETMQAPHVAYGDLLNPYLISLLESGDRPETTKRIFGFLEELANHRDLLVQQVVAVTVMEQLTDKEEWLTAAWPYMGPTSRQIAREVAEYWGTSPSFPFG